MRREIPAIRILPMSNKIEGFRGRTVAEVQATVFLQKLPKRKGRYPYLGTGLKAEPGTVVLFQFSAHVIASAVFIRDEKFEKGEATAGGGGLLHFEVESFRTFDPLNADAIRKIWPGFRSFGHAKQALNPTLYPLFSKRLKQVVSPAKLLERRRILK